MTKFVMVCPPQQQELYYLTEGVGDAALLQTGWVDPENTPVYPKPLDHTVERRQQLVIMDNQHPTTSDEDYRTIPIPLVELFEKAKLYGATEIIVPDVYKDAIATFHSFQVFAEYSHDHLVNFRQFNYMFVPQGRSVEDWMFCFNEMDLNISSLLISAIGLPKYLDDPTFPGGGPGRRFMLLDQLSYEYGYHFLGVQGGWQDFLSHPKLRSWDSSLPVAAAQNKMYFTPTNQHRKFELDLDPLVRADPEIVMHNLNWIEDRLRTCHAAVVHE